MTFVNHDQIEEIRRELLVDVMLFSGACDSLIKAQIDFIRLVDGAIRDLGHRLRERLEIIRPRLVSKNVSIDKKEDAFFAT